MKFVDFLAKFIPHRDISDGKTLYLRRFFLYRGRFGNVFIHYINRSDSDRALHDHPWNFTTIILDGQYLEILEEGFSLSRTGDIHRYKAEHKHRVVLDEPVWTLVFTGRARRAWGFWTEAGWTHWRQFLNLPDAPTAKEDRVP